MTRFVLAGLHVLHFAFWLWCVVGWWNQPALDPVPADYDYHWQQITPRSRYCVCRFPDFQGVWLEVDGETFYRHQFSISSTRHYVALNYNRVGDKNSYGLVWDKDDGILQFQWPEPYRLIQLWPVVRPDCAVVE